MPPLLGKSTYPGCSDCRNHLYDLPVVACFLAATVSILLSFLRGHAIRRLFNALREDLP
jgi:hypothetical protein